ncbi:hypothetical protein GF325_04815 [Candidatus Bathyarchaeota archaeon]|nr:hypothetical protein [Candidatus Bathyarchaeota archaeon]
MGFDLTPAINIMVVFLLKAENGDHDFLLRNPPVNGKSFLDRFPKATRRYAVIHGLAHNRSSDELVASSSHRHELEAAVFIHGGRVHGKNERVWSQGEY